MPRDALGLVFSVRCPDPELGCYVNGLLEGLPLALDDGSAVRLELETVPTSGAGAVGADVVTLITNINVNAIAAAMGNLLFHAGAVSGPDGDVAVISGASGSGKSTLTARLVEFGLAYLTDETTCVDPITLQVTPFRKPLSLKPGSQVDLAHLRDTFGSAAARFSDDVWLIRYTELGGSPLPSTPLLPRVLIFPEYAVGKRLSVQRLSPGEAALALGENSSGLRAVRGGPLPALARLVEQAPAYRITHSDSEAAAHQVRELLAA